MGWNREAPQFTLCSCSPVPTSIPRWTRRLHLVISSPSVVAFALFAGARHPHCVFRGCKVRFMLRPGRLLALLTRTFTFELPLPGSPQGSVEYNYVGKQPIPTAGLAPASHAALWAATDNRRLCAESSTRWPREKPRDTRVKKNSL